MASKSWTIDPTKFAALAEDEHKKLISAVGVDIGTRLIFKTPVDTGRAQNGWLPSIGAPAAGEGGVADPSGTTALSKIVSTFRPNVLPNGPVLYVSNNVPYIGELNNGHSKQAPANFVGMAVSEVSDVL